MTSSNTELVWPEDTRAVALYPAGHNVTITPRPWKYGSTTISITATAFNRTLGELLYVQQNISQLPHLNEIELNELNPMSEMMGTTNDSISTGSIQATPCELYQLVAAAVTHNVDNQQQTYVLARKSFTLRINQTVCYGFVELFPGTFGIWECVYEWHFLDTEMCGLVYEATSLTQACNRLDLFFVLSLSRFLSLFLVCAEVYDYMHWDSKINVSARNFPFIVMATSSLIEIPLLITLLPIVDRSCFRKLLLYVFGAGVVRF